MNGVVIFATNLAANFDPAFERRIRTHVLFEMPGPAERERIWQVQVHPTRTPLADDVDFRALAERFEGSGGDIKNAVLKAAAAAANEPGSDAAKRIHQHHLVAAAEEVLAAKRVMRQSIFEGEEAERDDPYVQAIRAAEERWRAVALAGIAVGGSGLLAGIVALVVALAR